MKYAHMEVERRFLVSSLPVGTGPAADVLDFYLDGTRLRLREINSDGHIIRKLGQKIRLDDSPRRIAHTTMYLDDGEWDVLSAIPSRRLHKRRYQVVRDGYDFAIDEHDDGTLIAEFDGGDDVPGDPPPWLDVIREVTDEVAYIGGQLASE